MKYASLVLILLTALFFGRPTECEHKQAVFYEAANLIDVDKNDALFRATSTMTIERHIEVSDYYLFSVGRINGQVISIGALRIVHIQTKYLTLKLLR